jgi:tetratricopeptide (TPR) repeat protein
VFLFGLGSTHLVSGSLNEALEVFLEVGRVLEGEDEERFVAAAKGNVALAKLMLGDLDAAQETAEEALRLSKEVGSRSSWGSSLYTMAHVAMCRGDVASAERLCRDSIATLEEGGLNAALSGRFTFLSELLTSSGDYAGALESLHRSVTRLRDLHMERDLADCARAAGRWCLAVGDFRDAARFLAFYSPFPAQGFHGRSKADPRPDPSELLGQAKAALRPDEFEACCRDGRTWTLAEMLEAVLALAVPEPVRRASGKAKA